MQLILSGGGEGEKKYMYFVWEMLQDKVVPWDSGEMFGGKSQAHSILNVMKALCSQIKAKVRIF